MRYVLLILLMLNSFCGIAKAEVEDLSTYTIGGTDSAFLSANETSVTASTSMQDNDTAYAYKDYGASYFGEFDIDLQVYINTQGSSSLMNVFCLSNTADATGGGMNTANDGICINFTRFGDDGWRIRNYNDDNNSDLIAGAAYQTRYLTLTRVGSTMTLNLYTDSNRTTHASGSPVTANVPTTKFRYLYAFASGGSDGWAGSTSAGTTSNIEIVSADGDGEPETSRRVICVQ